MGTGRDVEGVYRRQHARLWRSLLSFTCDPDLASDAEAEAFAQALRRGDAVDDLEAWIWRSAFKIAAGLLAARRSDGDAARRHTVEHVVEPSVAEFLALLGSLTEQQRACVALRYTGGFTSIEIAEMLGTSPGTVRVQLHRAHDSLRRSLDPNAARSREGS